MARRLTEITFDTNMGPQRISVAELEPMELGYICRAFSVPWVRVKYAVTAGHLFDQGAAWATIDAEGGVDIRAKATRMLVERYRQMLRRKLGR